MASVFFFGVVGTIGYSLIFYRAAPGDYSEGHAYRHNWKLEVTWLVIPAILVTWIVSYSVNIYTRMEIAGPTKLLATSNPESEAMQRENNNGEAIIIGVVAKQWGLGFSLS